jgi:hypothetical protein
MHRYHDPRRHLTALVGAQFRDFRTRILALVLGLSIGTIAVIGTAEGEMQILFQNVTLAVASAAAFILSFIIFHSFRLPSYRNTVMMLMIGLGLWCAAELTWAYYVQVLKVDVPFPSAADLFYLGGYFFVGSFLLRIARRLAYANKRNVLVISTISISIVATIVNIFILELVRDSFTVTSLNLNQIMTLTLSVAYPILDGLLLIPSMIILYESRANKGQYLSWIMMSIGMLLLGIADTGFGYTALKNIEALASEAIWDIIFGLSYIFIISSLLHEFIAMRKAGTSLLLQTTHSGDNNGSIVA